jgi:hypothetical protein
MESVENVEQIAQKLQALDEEALTAQIGAYSKAIEISPNADSVDSLANLSAPRGIMDDFLKIGNSVFSSASTQAYELLCTPVGEDSGLAEELDKLMNEKTTEAAAKMSNLLAPVLVSSLGLPQTIALLVGSLIVKKVAKGTSDFICKNWETVLLSDPENPPAA